MAGWMDRETGVYAPMGGEGVPRSGASSFNGGKHFSEPGRGHVGSQLGPRLPFVQAVGATKTK